MLLGSVPVFNMLYFFAQNILEVLKAVDWIRRKAELGFLSGTVHFPYVRHFLPFKHYLETVDHYVALQCSNWADIQWFKILKIVSSVWIAYRYSRFANFGMRQYTELDISWSTNAVVDWIVF